MNKTTEQEITEGWKWLINATKWHYFVDHRSLCGKWATFSMKGFQQGDDDSPDNCAMCKKRKKARDKKD